MSRVLIVCDTKKGSETYKGLFIKYGYSDIDISESCDDARRKTMGLSFDVVLINAPMRGESAEEAAIDIASRNESQVIFMVKNEYLEETGSRLAKYGVITSGKPIQVVEFKGVIRYAEIAQIRINMAKSENSRLRKKLNDLKIVTRAKLLLVQYAKMTEDEAHHLIERRAMDERKSRAEVARDIIEVYE